MSRGQREVLKVVCADLAEAIGDDTELPRALKLQLLALTKLLYSALYDLNRIGDALNRAHPDMSGGL